MTKRKRRVILSDPNDLAALVLETPGLVDKLGDAMVEAAAKLGQTLDADDEHAVRQTIKTTIIAMAPGWALDLESGEPCKVDT